MDKIYKICEKGYDPETKRIIIKKIHNIYLDGENETIHIETPITVNMYLYIKKILRVNRIKYKNIIVGTPDI